MLNKLRILFFVQNRIIIEKIKNIITKLKKKFYIINFIIFI